MSSIVDRLPSILERILKGKNMDIADTPPVEASGPNVKYTTPSETQKTIPSVSDVSDVVMELFTCKPRRVASDKLIWVRTCPSISCTMHFG